MTLQSKKSNLIASHADGLSSRKENVGDKEKKPEPYFINTRYLHDLIEIHTRALSFYNGMAVSYKTLELEPLTPAIFQQLEYNDLAEMKQKYFARIESELDKAGIKNEQIRINMREGTDKPWHDFVTSIEKNIGLIAMVQSHQPDVKIDLNSYSIENGEIMFTEADKEKIKLNRASVYLDSAAKEKYAMLCQTIIGDLAKLRIILKENGIKETFGYDATFRIENTPEGQIVSFNKVITNHIQF
ncbi:MAG: hypothetical protein M0P71_17015 [Melioribacteraceae bacterium]|jgi:hypothetical protein|nr:hypothetical protein [Melioribacteraceae bacterium]